MHARSCVRARTLTRGRVRRSFDLANGFLLLECLFAGSGHPRTFDEVGPRARLQSSQRVALLLFLAPYLPYLLLSPPISSLPTLHPKPTQTHSSVPTFGAGFSATC
eukprot:6189056-Pleurochrysis_carterae.AAC.2